MGIIQNFINQTIRYAQDAKTSVLGAYIRYLVSLLYAVRMIKTDRFFIRTAGINNYISIDYARKKENAQMVHKKRT